MSDREEIEPIEDRKIIEIPDKVFDTYLKSILPDQALIDQFITSLHKLDQKLIVPLSGYHLPKGSGEDQWDLYRLLQQLNEIPKKVIDTDLYFWGEKSGLILVRTDSNLWMSPDKRDINIRYRVYNPQGFQADIIEGEDTEAQIATLKIRMNQGKDQTVTIEVSEKDIYDTSTGCTTRQTGTIIYKQSPEDNNWGRDRGKTIVEYTYEITATAGDITNVSDTQENDIYKRIDTGHLSVRHHNEAPLFS